MKLTDFGIARVPGTGSLTGPGMLKGKLGYMAPEQASAHKMLTCPPVLCRSGRNRDVT